MDQKQTTLESAEVARFYDAVRQSPLSKVPQGLEVTMDVLSKPHAQNTAAGN